MTTLILQGKKKWLIVQSTPSVSGSYALNSDRTINNIWYKSENGEIICTEDIDVYKRQVMDGAFLVSFDVATKKAYTSVAVKMSTKELSVLAQPGGTFYGVDKMDNGKIVIFGGGVPLKVGDTIIGGLGISGGTGEEDHSLAEYGLCVLNEVL